MDKPEDIYMINKMNTLVELEKKLAWYEKRYGPYIQKRGIKNFKNLFRWPTSSEWMVFVMLGFILVMAWAYKNDTASCREFLDNIDVNACLLCDQQKTIQAKEVMGSGLLIFNEENLSIPPS